MKEYYLKTSEIFVSKEEYKITTVLGSCIAVCLWDRLEKYGGINHYLLPKSTEKNPIAIKYGDVSIQELIFRMNKLGSLTKNLEAQVYGGAQVLNEKLTIGKDNIKIAYTILDKHNINIVQSDTGGLIARKIIYYNTTNKIQLIKLNKIL